LEETVTPPSKPPKAGSDPPKKPASETVDESAGTDDTASAGNRPKTRANQTAGANADSNVSAGASSSPPTSPPKLVAKNEVVGSGEFRSSADVVSGLVSGIVGFSVKRVRVANVKGLAMFEGDISLGSIDKFKKTSDAAQSINVHSNLTASGRANVARDVQNAVVITGQRFRWPNGLIPYEVDPSIDAIVQQAIDHWTQNTSIRFVLRTPVNAASFPNFVSFEVGDGCFSAVGMQGGSQVISIGLGCGVGQAIHEIGHTVGLWHEQGREDRDQFVHIAWENILPNMEHNFDQHITDGDDVGPYDYGSIMHYPAKAFSSNGLDTIVALGGQQIGQRDGLSSADIAAVLELYPGTTGSGRHMYTSLVLELATAIGAHGFKSDGVGFYGWPLPIPGTVPILKLSDATGKQLYTTSLEEAFAAISKDAFTFDEVPCYIFASPFQGLTPLFRLDNAAQQDSLLTTSVAEATQAASHGYAGQGVAGHVLSAYVPGSVPVYRLSKAG